MGRNKIIVILLGLAAIAAFFWLDLGRFLTLESLKRNREVLQGLYAGHQMAMVAAFMAVYIIQTGLALPGATIMSLAAGAIFGPLMGTVYAVISASIGATLAFLLTRYLLRDLALNRFGSKLEGINKELEEHGLNYLMFQRFVPLFPFFLINLAAGLTRLPLRTFIIGTAIGIIPGGFVYVNAGSSLASISSPGDIASPRVLGSFALLGLFALVPALYNKYKGRNI
jgi:uncharacterized membrane protein YdjX (TVP38/TMEM64 family)